MGIFDELGKALKQIGEEVKRSDLDRHTKNLEQGLNKAGRNISAEIDKARSPHPGYQKIAAWLKRNYPGRIPVSGDQYQNSLQLEQLTAEACREFPAKTKKGFMDYLKKQNYEPLLK